MVLCVGLCGVVCDDDESNLFAFEGLSDGGGRCVSCVVVVWCCTVWCSVALCGVVRKV